MSAPAVPEIVRALYDGDSVKVWWLLQDQQNVTGFKIRVAFSAQGLAFESDLIVGAQRTFGELLGVGALDLNVAYTVQVVAWTEAGAGPSSPEVPLVAARPELRRAFYDGSVVAFEWTPSPQAAGGYLLQVSGAGSAYFVTLDDPHACRGVIPAADLPPGGLDPQLSWAASVCALGGSNVSGCTGNELFPAPLPVLALARAVYTPERGLAASWSPVASGIDRYRLTVESALDDTSFAVDVPGGTTASGELPLPQALAPGQDYRFRLLALTAEGVGVATPALSIVSAVPRLLAADYDGQRVRLWWRVSPDPAVEGYTLEVVPLDGGQVLSAQVVGRDTRSGEVEATLAAGQAYTARVVATATGRVGGASESLELLVSAPVLRTVQVDGAGIGLEWQPLDQAQPGALECYRALLLDGDGILAAAVVRGSSARLPLAGGGAPEVLVTAARAGVTGPPSARVAPLLEAPAVTQAGTDPLTGRATVSWSAVDGASGYRVQVGSAQAVEVAETSYELPAPLAANADVRLRVTAVAQRQGVALRGPASAAFELPAAQAVLRTVDFDGLRVRASWEAVAGASGYRLSVLSDQTVVQQVAASAAEHTLVFEAALPNTTQTYTLTLQALFGASSGLPGPQRALFEPAFFPSPQPATTFFPFVFPASTLAAASPAAAGPHGEDLTLYLPQIGGPAGLSGLPLQRGPFTLADNPDQATRTRYPYVLQVPGNSSVWMFGTEPLRPVLRADSVAFLLAVEAAGALPWGVLQLQQYLGRCLPLTYQELLYYNFGLVFPGGGVPFGSVDLRPGVVLRVTVPGYFDDGDETRMRWINGYTGGPTLDYDVGSFGPDGQDQVGFDAFIGQLVANQALAVPPPQVDLDRQRSGAADAADLYFAAFRQPFYRLFVPSQLPSANAPAGTVPEVNFTLAAAPTLQALLDASPRSAGQALAYFRSRAVVRVCLRVTVDGVEAMVPVGTTVANLLERLGQRPPSGPLPLAGLQLERSLGATVFDPSAPVDVGRSYRVRLDWMTVPVYGPGWDALSLPLLPGDRLTTRG